MLLADKVAPYPRQVRAFAGRMYGDLFGGKVGVAFDLSMFGTSARWRR